VEILKDDYNKLVLSWDIPIQTMTTVKNDKEYHSFRVSFPLDLKNYIESNVGSLDKIDFYEAAIASPAINVPDKIQNDFVRGSTVTFVAIGGSLPAGAVCVASPKLVSFKKKGQLFVTLPKKVSLFKNLDVNVKSMLKYLLVYDNNVKDYLLLVDVINLDTS